jgi:hypothetical protein
LHYTLVGSGAFAITSLSDYYRQASLDDLGWVLENRLFEIMGPQWWYDSRVDRTFQMQSDYDVWLPVNFLIQPSREPLNGILIEARHNLALPKISKGEPVQLKGFVIIKVDSKRRELTLNLPARPKGLPPVSCRLRLQDVAEIDGYRVGQILDSLHGLVVATRHDLLVEQVQQALAQAVDLSAERLALPGNRTILSTRNSAALPSSLPNPLLTYQNLLQNFLTVNISTIHGDLNLENILVDPETREVSLIDFATVRQGHVLHDLLRLETEVLISLLPAILVESKLPLQAVFSFYYQLHQATLPADPLASLKLPHPALAKPFEMLRVIRAMAQKCLFDPDDWREYYQGLILYLLGALKFSRLDELPTAPLPKQVAFWGAALAQQMLNELAAAATRPKRRRNWSPAAPLLRPASTPAVEPPFGTLRPDSNFYIERTADSQCWQQVTSPYPATLLVQAPMQMGKSSLIRRILYLAKQTDQKQIAFIDFQKFTAQDLVAEENFFIQLSLMIGDSLGVPEAIDQYWSGRRTNIIKCGLYLSQYLIPRLNHPFILAMDEVERMETSPFRANFFGMLRTWHNDRVENEDFAKMTLLLSSSTDPYLLIDNPYQSPFNVATPIPLDDFTLEEVSELNKRHHSPLDQAQVHELMGLVHGHPFLTRLALYQLALGKIDLPLLLAQAADDNGPFGDHLRHYLHRVWQKPELKQALTLIAQKQSYEENQIFHRLRGAGLVKRVGQQVVFRNSLYERYFKERLHG